MVWLSILWQTRWLVISTAKALTKIGAITTTVNAIIAVIVASILYIALRPVMKKTDMLRDL